MAEKEFVIKEGEKRFVYGRDEKGELELLEAQGLENPDKLLERMKKAKITAENCGLCMRAQMWRDVMSFIFMEFLGGEEE